MGDFIRPQDVPLVEQPEPKPGRPLYAVNAVLEIDGGIIDGVRPGNIMVNWGTVDRVLPQEGGAPMTAILRGSFLVEAVYDPARKRLPERLSDRPGPYYGGMGAEDPKRTREIRNGDTLVGRLVVSAARNMGPHIIYHESYREAAAGYHMLSRITDQLDVATGVVRAICSAMQLPSETTEWLTEQVLTAKQWAA